MNEVLQRQDCFCIKWWSSWFLSLGSCGFDTVCCALRNETALEVGYSSKHMEDQFTCGGCGFDALFETDQPDVLCLQVLDGL